MAREYKVMIAEDEELIRNSLKRNIESCGLGFRVTALAEDGAALLERVAEQVPHVVITDICMPVVDGIELIHKLETSYPEILKVVVSGYDKFEYAREAFRGRVKDYLLKPVVKEDMMTLLLRLKADLDDRYAWVEERLEDRQAKQSGLKYSIEDVVSLISDHLKKNYTGEIHLEEYLSEFPFNPAYISRSFARIKGASPSRYLTDLRINRAKQLLDNHPDMHVKEIAALTGYENEAYFCRLFKKTTGLTPSRYRYLNCCS